MPPALSIVAPCYNEESCLADLHARVSAAARATVDEDYEFVLVDDGSRDRTWSMIRALAGSDPHLMAVSLSRNFGHQRALSAGLDLCSGERILVIDADLQDPPELLPAMMAEMDRQQAEVVYGVRRSREGESALKRGTAHLFYRGLSRMSEIDIPADAGDFRLLTRRALDTLLSLPEQARFIRGLVAWVGFKQVPILYDRDARHSGVTKYPWRKMVKLAADALTAFSTVPLKVARHIGLALVLLSLVLLAYVLFSWWTQDLVHGWASLMVLVSVLGAANMFALAMIGEYLGRVYFEVKRRPLYIVSEIVGRAPGAHRLGYVAEPRESTASNDKPGGKGKRPIA
jgi:glycosyltransferase involved in cell wall biosynthesis